uniref:DUF1540 domain-containing protein n=1 Tax=viral metagenome TaxID=1070528 RepID=A0A6M3KM52_9ZZZZ
MEMSKMKCSNCKYLDGEECDMMIGGGGKQVEKNTLAFACDCEGLGASLIIVKPDEFYCAMFENK